MGLQVKGAQGCWQPPELGQRHATGSTSELLGGIGLADFWPLEP